MLSRAVSLLFGVLTVAAVLLFLSLSANVTHSSPQTLEVRQLAAMLPPPPPPVPQVTQSQTQPDVSLQVQGTGASVEMQTLKVDVDTTLPDTPPVAIESPKLNSLQMQVTSFSLNQLDDQPRLLTPVQIQMPRSLKSKGIHRVVIKLEVMIQKSGDVNLLAIVENPHPELTREIARMVQATRFSAPMKNNHPVNARFIWPLEIKA